MSHRLPGLTSVLIGITVFVASTGRADVPKVPTGQNVTAVRASPTPFDSFDRAVRESSLPDDLKQQIQSIHGSAQSECKRVLLTAATQPSPNVPATLTSILTRANHDIDALLTPGQRAELHRLEPIARCETALDRYGSTLSRLDLTPDQRTHVAAVLAEARSRLHETGHPDVVDTQAKLLAILTDDQKHSPELAVLRLPAGLIAPDAPLTREQKAEARQQTLGVLQELLLNSYEKRLGRVALSAQQQSEVAAILKEARSQSAAGKQVVRETERRLAAVLTDEQRQSPELGFLLRPPATRAADPLAAPK